MKTMFKLISNETVFDPFGRAGDGVRRFRSGPNRLWHDQSAPGAGLLVTA